MACVGCTLAGQHALQHIICTRWLERRAAALRVLRLAQENVDKHHVADLPRLRGQVGATWGP
jgi:hypothetical protein